MFKMATVAATNIARHQSLAHSDHNRFCIVACFAVPPASTTGLINDWLARQGLAPCFVNIVARPSQVPDSSRKTKRANQCRRHCHDLAGRERTWTQTQDRIASWLERCKPGLRRGDRAAILALNSDRYFEFYYELGGRRVCPGQYPPGCARGRILVNRFAPRFYLWTISSCRVEALKDR